MTTVQLRNESMIAIASADLNPALDRNLAAEFYDGAGGQTFTTVITVNLDTTRINTASTVYALASDVVTVNMSGIYQVNWHLTVGHSTGSSVAVATAWLEQDTGGGFAEVAATRAYIPVPGASYGSSQVSSILRILEGYDYRLRVQRDDGSDTLVLRDEGARLALICLYATP